VHVGRVNVVLADVEDDPNGFATPLPYPLVHVRAVAPDGSDDFGNYDDWLRLVPLQDLGGEGGRAARHLLQALVEVHGDAVGGDAAEMEIGRKRRGARRGGAGQEQQGCEEQPAGAATHERTRVP
jgi:hypothetical protein